MTDHDLHAEAEQAARQVQRRRYVIQGAISMVVACLSVTSTLAIQGMVNAEDERDQNATIAETYSSQLEQQGIEPAVDPELIQGDAGPQGETGPQGEQGPAGPAVSSADILTAVRTYCAGGRCKGAPGQAGPAVTTAQVAAAVRTYCSADGRCRGAAGATGAEGTDGQDGQDGKDGSTGPQGPPPTDQQIQDAVAVFCASGACRGPAGEQGEPGPIGPTGPPGPTCPDGYTAEVRVVFTEAAPLGERAVLCIPTAA